MQTTYSNRSFVLAYGLMACNADLIFCIFVQDALMSAQADMIRPSALSKNFVKEQDGPMHDECALALLLSGGCSQ